MSVNFKINVIILQKKMKKLFRKKETKSITPIIEQKEIKYLFGNNIITKLNDIDFYEEIGVKVTDEIIILSGLLDIYLFNEYIKKSRSKELFKISIINKENDLIILNEMGRLYFVGFEANMGEVAKISLYFEKVT